MRFIKVLGLAAVAAVAAMAFVGAGSASAQDEIVLCKVLVEKGKLCPKGELLPAETLLLALAKDPILKNSISTVLCEDSVVTAKSKAQIGNPLGILITQLSFGALPTPSLGNGCTTCIGGIHTDTEAGKHYEASIHVKEVDHFFFLSNGSATLLNCFGLGINCSYGSETIEALIDHGGTHEINKKVVPVFGVILIKSTLERKAGSSGFCPATGTWEANYAIYQCHPPNEPTVNVNCWLALDTKV